MAKIQAVWAIDIGQSALKAIKLVPGETAEQVVAEAFDFIEYPEDLEPAGRRSGRAGTRSIGHVH